MKDSRYDLIYSVENVNREVLAGKSFRDAYKNIAKSIADGSFQPIKELKHTHVGSIGNPGTKEIRSKLKVVTKNFDFGKYQEKLQQLIES